MVLISSLNIYSYEHFKIQKAAVRRPKGRSVTSQKGAARPLRLQSGAAGRNHNEQRPRPPVFINISHKHLQHISLYLKHLFA